MVSEIIISFSGCLWVFIEMEWFKFGNNTKYSTQRLYNNKYSAQRLFNAKYYD